MYTMSSFPWDVIIAHGPGCHDGATAAWAVWRSMPEAYRLALGQWGGFYAKPKKFEEGDDELVFDENYVHPNSPAGAIALQKHGLAVVFVFMQPGKEVPEELVKNKRVLVLDLDMGDALVSLVKAAKSVKLCDHHDTTMATILKHSDVLLNQDRAKFSMFVDTRTAESGASLAWKLSHAAVVPKFVDTVRIGDTWQWDENPNARYILDALWVNRSFRSFPDIEETFQTFEQMESSYVREGRVLFQYKEALAKSMAKHCELAYVRTKDGKVYTVAYAAISTLRSEVGNKMRFYAEKRFKMPIDFAAVWTYMPDHKMVQVSIRDPAPGLNLGEIARNIDGPDAKGGGHPKASGFTFSGIENFHKVFLTENPNPPVQLEEVVIDPTDEVKPATSAVQSPLTVPSVNQPSPVLVATAGPSTDPSVYKRACADRYETMFCGQVTTSGSKFCPICHTKAVTSRVNSTPIPWHLVVHNDNLREINSNFVLAPSSDGFLTAIGLWDVGSWTVNPLTPFDQHIAQDLGFRIPILTTVKEESLMTTMADASTSVTPITD